MDTASFKGNFEDVEVEEDLLFDNISGAYLKAEMGVLTGATLNGKNAVLDAVGESIEWHNLPSYKDFYVVYKANTAGTIKAYYGSNYEQFYAFPVSATNGEYATVYLAIGSKPSEKAAIPAGQSIKIVFEEGNVAVEIREIILMGYIHSADQSVTQAQSESIFTPANAETSDYPAYTNVNNKTLELTVTEKANAIMVVLMAKADLTVNFTLTYNGKEYEGKMIGSGWNTAKLVFITMDEYVEAGGSVSLKIDNNTNVCAIYAMDTADFKTVE